MIATAFYPPSRLTIQHSKPQNTHAFDASRDGPENPIEVRRTCATLGRIFYAQIPSLWRLVRGKVRPLPVPNFRFLSPVSSRHPNALRSDVAAPFIQLGA